jgi:type IV pilus assembly protein PilC
MPKKLQRKPATRTAEAAPPVAAVAGGQAKGGWSPLASRRVSSRALMEFTTQLATLLDAGIPIVRCLKILEGQLSPGMLKRVLFQTTEEVEGGTSLSDALAKHPKVFDRLYTNMVRAGEAGGVQETILNRLAGFMEKAETIKQKTKGALAYPISVFLVASGMLTLVFIFVIPKFREIFRQIFKTEDELPPLTRYLISFAEHLKVWWWVYFLSVALVVMTHSLLRRRVRGYRRGTDATLLRLPLFGRLVQKTLVARFARTFGTLIQSGVPHLEALEIVKGAIANVVVTDSVERVHASIKEGEGIARPMGESGIFDDIVVNMVDVGEETGELDRMLIKIADRFDAEVDRTVDVVFRTAEVALIVIMAVVVGVIVFALLAPMLKLMEKFQSR